MIIFAFLIIIVFFLAFFFYGRGKRANDSYIIICFCLLVLLRVSLNWKEWGDLPEYFNAFQHTLYHDFLYYEKTGWEVPDFKSERGWIIYTWLNSHTIPNFVSFLFVSGCIISYGYFFTIRKYVNYGLVWLPILIYILGPYLQSFYVLRQHMAMSVALLSYPFILNRQFAKFLIVIITSTAIHQTALFVFPLYFLYGIKKKRPLLLGIALYSIIVFAIVSYIGSTSDLLIDGYNTYLRANEDEFSNYKTAALLCGLLAIRLVSLKSVFGEDGITKLLSIVLILGCINAIIGAGRIMFMSRLNMYYSEIVFLILPNTISYIHNRFVRYSIAFGYVIFMGYFFFSRYNVYHTGSFVWE